MHPLVAAAARGVLPDWAEAGPARVEHMRRVAALMEEWACTLDLQPGERDRWRAAGMLHDVLREAAPASLATEVEPHLRDVPPSLLHGPAAAARLRSLGVGDEGLLEAVAFHTIGRAGLGALGRMLYAADFLEPGRSFEQEWRAGLRRRMPEEAAAVLPAVVAARIRHLLEAGSKVRPESLGFWNALVQEGW
jgi:2-amino-4-hydroxy-6-hydroxymethyldihydropteridine diphosphokinase